MARSPNSLRSAMFNFLPARFKKMGRPKPPQGDRYDRRTLERDFESNPEQTRVGLEDLLAEIRVVGAGRGRCGRAAARARLDARLTVERARLIRDDGTVEVEGGVERGRGLPVEDVEEIDLRSDGDRSDRRVVGEREVQIVIGRGPAEGSALLEVE